MLKTVACWCKEGIWKELEKNAWLLEDVSNRLALFKAN